MRRPLLIPAVVAGGLLLPSSAGAEIVKAPTGERSTVKVNSATLKTFNRCLGRIDDRDGDRGRRRRRAPQGAGRSELVLRGHGDGEILLARSRHHGRYHSPCVTWWRA